MASVSADLLDDVNRLYEAALRWKENIHLLEKWTVYAALTSSLDELGLNEINNRYLAGESAITLCRSFEAGYHKAQAMKIISQDSSLSEYNGIQLSAALSKYSSLQKEFQEVSQKELVCRVASNAHTRITDQAVSAEMTLLRKRIGNKGRGTTIRTMIAQMPNLLQHLCPVVYT